MARVEFKRVGKTYADGTRALKELDITVGDGELLVVVGPSGCGKSTLVKAIYNRKFSVSPIWVT